MPAVRNAKFIDREHNRDTVEITAEANNQLWTWSSRRTLDPLAMTIAFERIDLPDAVTLMRGKWVILPMGEDKCVIELHHEFAVQPGHQDVEDFLTRSIKSNASRDLEAMARYLPTATL